MWRLRQSGAIIAALLVIAALTAGPASAAVPAVTTGAANSIGRTEATITGSIVPNGHKLDYAFQYGLTSRYDHQTTPIPITTTASVAFVSTTIGNLSPGSVYHYRLVVGYMLPNGYYYYYPTTVVGGADATFTTLSGATSKVGLASHTAHVRHGKARVKLACSGATGCTGRLTISRKVNGQSTRFGSSRYTVAAGATKTVKVRLSATAKTYLKAHGGRAVTRAKAKASPGESGFKHKRLVLKH
jgi:hypothetical protein